MPINEAQLAAILSRALPGERLREAEPLGARTWLLRTGDRRRLVLRLPAEADAWAGPPHEAEALALGALTRELEPRLAELLAHEPGPAGFTLLGYLEGQPLPAVIEQLSEEHRYAVGRELGALLARVHAYAPASYGQLQTGGSIALSRVVQEPAASFEPQPRSLRLRAEPAPDEIDAPADERDQRYLVARLDAALASAVAEGTLAEDESERIAGWARANLPSSGQPPCLTHGDLAPERLLVRRRERGWALSGLIGWGAALAWRPGWDHVTMQGAFAEEQYFSLRAGYGNAYDELTERRYDQLREFALLPYRLVLALEAGLPELALALVGAE
jgi:aminoglycoside phosphotransferase (APT) family kinase protein